MTASLVVPDPYQALQVPRNATQATIKRSYRELARKFHPDRLTQASANEREKATTQFAAIASAYALLSDPQRKAQYDHIYKYGGYDEPDLQEGRHRTSRRAASSSEAGGASCANSSDATDPTSNHQHYHPNNNLRKRKKATGIGYSCVDPLAFLWTNGRVQSQRAVAGIEIPSRLQHAAGLRFAFSSAHLSTTVPATTGAAGSGDPASATAPPTHQWKSHTTQFIHGKKYTRVETTTWHADGRKEVIIEDNDDQDDRTRRERRYVIHPDPPPPKDDDNNNAPPQQPQQQHQSQSTVQEPGGARNTSTAPWYAHAWHGLKDKLTMCYHPCTVVA